jgi:transcription elongation factor Elf1
MSANARCLDETNHEWPKLQPTQFRGCFDCRRFEVVAFTCRHGASVAVRWCSLCGVYFFEKEANRHGSSQKN